MERNRIAVAIDGPAGAGKSTIARTVAQKLGFVYVDTGALYRTIGLAAARRNIAGTDHEKVIQMLPDLAIRLVYESGMQNVLLNGENVTAQIRTPEISVYASQVSAMPEVRAFLLDVQRNLAKEQSVIMDGRDIGTVILPQAEVKIFLTASLEARSARRFAELQAKDPNVKMEQVLADMECRDRLDASRAIAPLQQAKDAYLIDTSSLTLEESIQAVYQQICEKIKENA